VAELVEAFFDARLPASEAADLFAERAKDMLGSIVG
jgi:hypothetical protein